MFKLLLHICFGSVLLASCSGLKTLTLNPNQGKKDIEVPPSNKEKKFLNDIVVNNSSDSNDSFIDQKSSFIKESSKQSDKGQGNFAYSSTGNEKTTSLQLKYAILLDTRVEEVQNVKLFEYIDQWYGTPYCIGGTTKSCIDCSAFVQALFASIYGIILPRTAYDQYKKSKRISRTDLKEGDLVFYNTRGGISHVGIYLQNNKFIHASTTGGVMISDIFDEYWVKKFIAVGRIGK